MARNRGSGIFGMIALGAVTIAGGATLGYYVIAGAHPGHGGYDPTGIQEASAPPASAPPPAPATRPLVHVRPNSDYTAPGAPHIHIVENRTPTLTSPRHPPPAPPAPAATDIPTPDAEASQQGAADGSSTPVPDTPAPAGTQSSPDSSAASADPATAAPGDNAGTGGSPPGQSASPATDPEASQAGASPVAPTTAPPGRAQYRIQAGSFSNAPDAQSYVNTLQGKGIDASVSTQSLSGQTVYKVQVGAYHDHAAAEQAAAGFRRQGVPVTVTAITP